MFDGWAEYGYWGLLTASFLAATILPLSSEVVFAALVAAGYNLWDCILFATVGNSAGGATCYYLGRLGKMEWLEKWFHVKPEKLHGMIVRLHGKGALMGFFGFLPIIGDLTLVALGFMRANTTLTLASMTAGKFFRYVLIAFGTGQIINWL